jgi:hypothetical protein
MEGRKEGSSSQERSRRKELGLGMSVWMEAMRGVWSEVGRWPEVRDGADEGTVKSGERRLSPFICPGEQSVKET